ncbi:MAG TPA: carboxypeptidase regulatory-like domain-containing protein [Bacillota bacterium]|nr:carboxypeptidase regulatory-like domain-containing protein [Bacillota bacterium]
MTITDRFLLTRSKEFSLGVNEEARVDLKLRMKPRRPETKITGRVTHRGVPVPGATVKVMDRKFNPVVHALTNKNGRYSIKNLMPGKYRLTAAAPGFLAAAGITFLLKDGKIARIDIRIKKDNTVRDYGFVYGTVTELTAGKVIEDAAVRLFSSGSDSPIAETASNESGQYLFCAIPPGKYLARAGKPGFLTSEPIRFEIPAGRTVMVPFLLQKGTAVTNATVSGSITRRFPEVKAGVWVGLFRVDGGCETLIRIKTADKEGLYLFTDVQPGDYVVKAKIQEKLEFCSAHKVM